MRLLLLAASLAAATPALSDTVALHCGETFDAKAARLVGARTIVATDGKLTQVLPGRVSVTGAREVDLSGHSRVSPGRPAPRSR